MEVYSLNIHQFEQSIQKLFNRELLQEFEDDFGFTYKADRTITTIGYCTNLSIETIEEAAKHHVDLMLTHHDAWDFIYGLKDDCVKKLKEYNISHFWIHGPLDFIEFGTSTSLMNVLGIDRVIKYSIYDNGEFPGIGEWNDPIDIAVLVKRMEDQLNEPIRVWRNHHQKVKKVGVLTGAGHSTDLIKLALDEGCDSYITGEASLYTIQYAQFVGINLLVGSHTFTEIFGVASLAQKLKDLNSSISLIELKETHFELNPNNG